MVLFANGDIPLCNVDFNNKYPLGNVMKNSIRELWQSKLAQDRRNLHLNNQKEKIELCKNCNVWDEVTGEELISPDLLTRSQYLIHEMKKAIVIGSGFSGCMFAMMLKEKNWQVTVVEKSKNNWWRSKNFWHGGHPFTFGPRHFIGPETSRPAFDFLN